MNGFLSGVVLMLVAAWIRRVVGECWDTGCQPDAWSLKGCEQYDGMAELKRTPCRLDATAVGHVYSCCHQKNSIDPAQRLCRATGCVLPAGSRPPVGCEQYRDTIEVERSPCGAEGGYAYFCCSDPNYVVPGSAAKLNRTGHLTHYSLMGLTACGQAYTNGDMVAAIAFGHFTTPNPNRDPVCGKRARIVDPTTLKSVVVTIWDKCEGCGIGDIDVSPVAFKQLKPLVVGRFKVVWDFI